MPTPNEFWLTLHQVVEAYRAEGVTEDERLKNIAEEFNAMPPLARREVMSDLAFAASHFPAIYAAIAPLMLRTERVAARRGMAVVRPPVDRNANGLSSQQK